MTQGVIVSIVLRGASVFLLLVAGAVGVNLIITPLYHQGGDAYPVWEALHWFMTPAVLITLAASYAEKRRIDGNGSADLKRYLEANTVFYGSVAVFLAYFWNRFMVLSPNHNGDSQIWILPRCCYAHIDGGSRSPLVAERLEQVGIPCNVRCRGVPGKLYPSAPQIQLRTSRQTWKNHLEKTKHRSCPVGQERCCFVQQPGPVRN